ncbi:long-chain fatty acid--CoA ligase [Persicobacter psychrovividus]|uniref:Long-chain-fatty-acid--CoA ligase n=1 Tax=Persicobacter psychrovividus TaxID=387638 RepID=A0ABM7VG17_9BACT|nr:long-chain-fatty-acid--CoA ligase [Persicobacter psychrovividus]
MKYEHLAVGFKNQAIKYQDRIAYYYQPYGSMDWVSTTWKDFANNVDLIASALLHYGVGVDEKVGIFSQNTPEWTTVDYAVMSVRGVVVPIYATNTLGQLEYILSDSTIKTLFVGGQEHYDKAVSILGTHPTLERIVVFDPSVQIDKSKQVMLFEEMLAVGESNNLRMEVSKRLATAKMDDLATIIYTSGTTGEPKGVMMDHSNFAFTNEIHDLRINLTEEDTSLCFLPLSHVFERAWTFYVFYKGMTNYYLRDTATVAEALKEVKPSVLCSVPRLFEKIYGTIYGKLEEAPKAKQKLFHWAVNVGTKVMNRRRLEKSVPLYLRMQHAVADKLVLSKIREAVGGRIKIMPCGGGKLNDNIVSFFHAVGLTVKIGYGMTETCASVTCFEDTHFDVRSAGKVMPKVEIRMGASNEILVKGGNVMRGYYKKPEATAEVLVDGWLRTGDAGRFDSHGNLVFEERLKDLMKTSGGKYIAPQMIESQVGKDQFIEQIAVIGDEKKYVTALIVPAFDVLADWAKKKNLEFNNVKEMLEHSTVAEFFNERLEALQSNLARFEKIKKFKLLGKEFTQESGELTPTMKIKRKVINTKYKKEIDEMYDEQQQKKKAS